MAHPTTTMEPLHDHPASLSKNARTVTVKSESNVVRETTEMTTVIKTMLKNPSQSSDDIMNGVCNEERKLVTRIPSPSVRIKTASRIPCSPTLATKQRSASQKLTKMDMHQSSAFGRTLSAPMKQASDTFRSSSSSLEKPARVGFSSDQDRTKSLIDAKHVRDMTMTVVREHANSLLNLLKEEMKVVNSLLTKTRDTMRLTHKEINYHSPRVISTAGVSGRTAQNLTERSTMPDTDSTLKGGRFKNILYNLVEKHVRDIRIRSSLDSKIDPSSKSYDKITQGVCDDIFQQLNADLKANNYVISTNDITQGQCQMAVPDLINQLVDSYWEMVESNAEVEKKFKATEAELDKSQLAVISMTKHNEELLVEKLEYQKLSKMARNQVQDFQNKLSQLDHINKELRVKLQQLQLENSWLRLGTAITKRAYLDQIVDKSSGCSDSVQCPYDPSTSRPLDPTNGSATIQSITKSPDEPGERKSEQDHVGQPTGATVQVDMKHSSSPCIKTLQEILDHHSETFRSVQSSTDEVFVQLKTTRN